MKESHYYEIIRVSAIAAGYFCSFLLRKKKYSISSIVFWLVCIVVKSCVIVEHRDNNNESRENISELNQIILNNSNSSFSFNAPNFSFISFTRVYFFIRSYFYYHLDPA
jgi:hypothetical protein